jgi:MFS family permease
MTVRHQEYRDRIWREPAPLRGVARLDCYPWLVVGTVCIGSFMGQADASIAQLVLPELEREFHASIGAVAWVSIAYLLVVAAMLPVLGRLAEIDELDLAVLGFAGVIPGATGRPSDHPVTLLKILSLRLFEPGSVEPAAGARNARNIEVMWLTGRLMPDFKTAIVQTCLVTFARLTDR